MKIKTLIASAAVALGVLSAPAMAVSITGGTTSVSVTADLAGLGLTPGLVGTASLGTPVDGFLTVDFPITGGSAGPNGNAIIEHDGSGVSLSDGTTTASVGNFIIRTAAKRVDGDLIGATTGSPLPFFRFGEGTQLPGVELTITSTLAGALTGAFGAPDLTGATFGYAVPNPELAPIPLPAAAWLLIGGLGALGAASRRRAKKAA